MNRGGDHAVVDSPVGPLELRADRCGNLITIRFTLPARPVPDITPRGQLPSALEPAATQLAEYFAGRRRTFQLPLSLQGTPFQQAAWRALGLIPYGATVSYSAQAVMAGKPEAARAVGLANRANPLPIVLPCHRVVCADGSLGGFGAGIARKLWLLDHERDRLCADPEGVRAGGALQPTLFPGER